MTKTKEQNDYEFCTRTIARMNELEEGYLDRAQDLHRIRSLNLYNPAWDSFEEFCMELKGIKYKSIMKLIAIHEKFVLQYKISPARIAKCGGWTTVAEILPMVNSKHDANKWLNIAENSTREHLRENVHEAKTGKDMTKCPHNDMYIFATCGDGCGYKERIYLTPSEMQRVLKANKTREA